ncbi:hypothetical protein BGX38DRAFT_1161398 [Terfezia claveryi]|nr:hypothetical protein BGX38DRAFT_1161398 [Terfezia claveryi]
MSSSKDKKPLLGTFLTTFPTTWGTAPYIYFQNNENRLAKLNPDGKIEVPQPQKPIKRHSPLSAFEYPYPPPPTLPAPQHHVLGTSPGGNDIIAIIPFEASEINIESAPGSKFAAFQHKLEVAYVQYQSSSCEIVETKLSDKTRHLVASNAATAQPIAAILIQDGFRSQHSVEAAKAKNLADPVLPYGLTRYTVYHGDDRYLWLSETWEFGSHIFSHQQKITTIPPDTIWNHQGQLSPLAISSAPGRLVVHFLNRLGTISRVSLHYQGGWGKLVEIGPRINPLKGTNLATSLQLINTTLHVTIHVAYQDEEGNIKSFPDTFVFNDPQ